MTSAWLPLPLVGRHRELSLVRALIDAGARSRGGLITISGEPGIGKTRLAEMATELARDAGYRVGWGVCWPDGGAPPLWPWHELLRAVAGDEATPLIDEHVEPAPVQPERFARFRAVAERLGRVSETVPLLLAIEDAHAADPASLLLARFVARTSFARRMVMLVTHREGIPDQGPLADALAGLAHDGVAFHLTGLSVSEVGELAAALGHELGQGEADALHRSTGGNPLFVRELLAATAEGHGRRLPAGVRRAMAHRLEWLDPVTRDVLRAAAVLGPSAPPTEVAELVRVAPAAVEQARRFAARAALVDDAPNQPITFVHDIARAALLEDLSSAELAAWHERAMSLLASDLNEADSERLIRRAHHAIAAGPAGVTPAVTVGACRAAAAALMRGFAYEAAADLLRAAVECQERAPRSRPEPGLLVELAHATLASGRLLDARPQFRRAAEVAEDCGDAEALADAALGLGGVWVLEHRAAEQRQYQALLRRAIGAVGDGDAARAGRLRARLAAEELYAGVGDFDAVVTAVDAVRAATGGRGLAEALSLLHHAMLGPRFATERLALADELLATATACGDGVLSLMGLLWRTVDLYLLGRPEAERSLVELRQRADTLNVGTARLVVREIEVMELIRAGRLDRAETAAGAAHALGLEVGDVDAPAWYGAQLLAIRWLQGRGGELLGLARDWVRSPDLPAMNQGYLAAVAVLAAEAGERDEAQAALDRLCRDGLDALAESSALLVTLALIAEAAAVIGDAAAADQVYERLLPYAELPVLGSLAVVCLGSAERPLGLAAMAMGSPDRAVAHLERAVTANRRLRNRPLVALAQADLAAALGERGLPGDEQRAAELRASAVELASQLGLDARARAWQAALREPRPGPAASGQLLRSGAVWEVAFGEERAVVPDAIGLSYLAELLSHPRTDIPVDQLAGREERASQQAVLDRQAVLAYRARVRELRREIDEAEADADIERASRLRLELDAVVDEIDASVRPGGRSRAFAGPTERARTSVQKAIRRAIDKIGQESPTLADALRRSVQTGTVCSYEPVGGLPERWEVR